MKRFGWTAVALVVFIGLLVWTLTKERGRVADKEEVFRGEIATADDLSKLQIVTYETAPPPATADATKAPPKPAVARDIKLEKRGEEWYVTAPLQGLIDPDTAKSLVKAVVELKPSVRKDANPATKEYGLSTPTLEVTATLRNEKQIKITVGADTPVGGKMYATISGKPGMFLVPSTLKTDLDKDPQTLRDKKLARFEKDKVARVTFVNQKGTVSAECEQESKEKAVWKITSPGAYKGDEWAISSAVGKITETEAKEFADQPTDLKRYGLDKPRAQCKVELADGKVFEIMIGGQIRKQVATIAPPTAPGAPPTPPTGGTEEKDLVYAMRKGRPEVLLVEATLFDDLNKDVMALRDKKILDIKKDQVLALNVERRQGLSFYAMRAGDNWMLQTPETGKANKQKIEDILWDIADLEAKEYLAGNPDLRAMGLAVPSTVVTLKLRGGKSLKIKFGDEVKVGEESQYYCQVADSPQVYKVAELTIKDLPAKAEDLKESAAGSLPPATSNAMPPTAN